MTLQMSNSPDFANRKESMLKFRQQNYIRNAKENVYERETKNEMAADGVPYVRVWCNVIGNSV